ncbi:MAG TPA: hypothetical protein PLU87_19305 [Sedimentisphaerales bacterium]|nr:hypothetical protein [Sedimentisphaerales bacterium]HRS13232.1 hypothetical protein [Sedimentisphaerales bacterium]HRV49818.1 hypothetical protein [Sedimentisphaerales bacterium]
MWNGSIPTGRIGNLTISRLIIGENQFSGWSHSRDLKYLRDLFKAYATEEKILQTLRLAEESGINTIIGSGSGYMKKHWQERGGKMQWIAQVHPKVNDLTTNIKQALDSGAVGAYVQGGVGDSFVKGGRIDLLGEAVAFIKSQGAIAGIGGHSIEVPIAVEKAGIQPDFYMKTLHHGNYWSATPKEQRVEFNVDSGGAQDHDNIWSITPEKTIDFMRNVTRPWIAFKVLAAGAIHPSDGFKYAFDNGADFICVGMFDFQIRENAIIARDAIAHAATRPRPWRA